jgi:DNA-binding IclR family transcriptional regulator
MPITIDEFDEHGSDREPTNAERVLRFLSENRENAYKASEIAESTSVNENSIHPVLNRLKARDLVRHKAPYWAIGDAEHVTGAVLLHSTASFLDEELGAESREEWLAAAREDRE